MAHRDQKNGSLKVTATPAIEKQIYAVRGRWVMLDEDLADLYGNETKRLIEQVKRNLERFPEGHHGAHRDYAGVCRATPNRQLLRGD